MNEHELSPSQVRLLNALEELRTSVNEDLRNIMSQTLSDIAYDHWGYAPDDLLNFEISAASNKVKVTKVEEEKK